MKRLALACALILPLLAQPPGTNYDESKVPDYKLPELLVTNAGQPVRDARAWTNVRRPEIFRLLETQMFGRVPPKPQKLTFELTSIDANALGGKATRKQIDIRTAGRTFRLLLYVPNAPRKPVPVFLGLNFNGNHTVDADPGIAPALVWRKEKDGPLQQAKGDDQTRGQQSSRWQLDTVLSRGYAFATIYYGDIEPDFAGAIQHGVRSAYLKSGAADPAADEWGAIGAWAWGLSRAVDYFESDKEIDARRVALTGHSRLGKTALWAGALDPRFAIVISNDSGEGGAAISRRVFGETVENLNTRFPHWFAANYRQYNGREQEMPFDSHMLLALIAPRPLYVASAQDDQWADPMGEFLAAAAATPVWHLFGRKGVETNEMPALHTPVGDFVRYHIRAGKHDVTAYDWEQWLAFADRHFGKSAK